MLATTLLYHIKAAATGEFCPETRSLALSEVFRDNDGNFREIVMDAVHSCPGLEDLSDHAFLEQTLQTIELGSGAMPGYLSA